MRNASQGQKGSQVPRMNTIKQLTPFNMTNQSEKDDTQPLNGQLKQLQQTMTMNPNNLVGP